VLPAPFLVLLLGS